jgi:hypothetical protein
MSTMGSAASGSTQQSVESVIGCAQRDVSAHAIIRMNTTLKISEGCTVKPPNAIHRRAPETVRPRAKTATRPASPTR